MNYNLCISNKKADSVFNKLDSVKTPFVMVSDKEEEKVTKPLWSMKKPATNTVRKEMDFLLANLHNLDAMPVTPYKIKKTKPCFNILDKGVCSNLNCTFAHFDEELEVQECFYGKKCKNPRCTAIHPEETLEAFYLKNPKPKLPKRE